MWRAGGIVVAGILLLGGCGSSDAPKASTNPTASATPSADASAACGLLTSADRTKLAQGSSVDQAMPISSDLIKNGCRWLPGDPADKTIIQTATMPSHVWAQSLPAALDQIASSGVRLSASDRKTIASIKKDVLSKKNLTDDQACSYFLSLSKLPGQTATKQGFAIRYVDLEATIGSATGQTCSHGIFTSVALIRQDLPQTPVTTDLVAEALSLAHERAVAAAK